MRRPASRLPVWALVTTCCTVGVLSFVGGYLLFARRLPDYLAALTREELRMLASRVAEKRAPDAVRAEAPRRQPFENIAGRQAQAEADVKAEARARMERELAGS